MTKDPWTWVEADLLDLIRLGVQESLELDYKRSEALSKMDSKKTEISKDVSAFANSAGGVLVYGLAEDGHIPTAIDGGVDPAELSKEWLEQVINSRIQRRIDGLRVNQVLLSTTSPGRVAYVVSIPQSARAPHQASDKRFYKRFNFESVPMEEYEVRDVANRTSAPALDIEFSFKPGGATATLEPSDDSWFSEIDVAATITNHSSAVAEYAVIHIFVDSRIRLGRLSPDVRLNPDESSLTFEAKQLALTKLTTLWDRSRGIPLFNGISAEVSSVPFKMILPRSEQPFALRYTIGSPGMDIRDEYVFVFVSDGQAEFVRPKKKASEPDASAAA